MHAILPIKSRADLQEHNAYQTFRYAYLSKAPRPAGQSQGVVTPAGDFLKMSSTLIRWSGPLLVLRSIAYA